MIIYDYLISRLRQFFGRRKRFKYMTNNERAKFAAYVIREIIDLREWDTDLEGNDMGKITKLTQATIKRTNKIRLIK